MKISKERITQIIKEEMEHALLQEENPIEDDNAARLTRHLDRIGEYTENLKKVFSPENAPHKEEIPEWILEKTTVAAAMLNAILRHKKTEAEK
jgi:hypothetical protein